MAYQKHNWLDRDTEFPDRRRLYPTDGGTERSYRVQRDEGTIYEEGDPFNAQQMNGLEARIAAADAGQAAALAAHREDVGNPHAVSAAQVGLGKADNTPDNEKSVKRATWADRLGMEAGSLDYIAVRAAAGTPQGYIFLQNQNNEYIQLGINGLGGRPVRNSQQLNGQAASYYATAAAAKSAADAAAAAQATANAAMPKTGGTYTGWVHIPDLRMGSGTGNAKLFMGSDGQAWLDMRTTGDGLLVRDLNTGDFRAVNASNTEHVSSRRYKEDIAPLAEKEVAALFDLPLYSWRYRADCPYNDGGIPHQGFIAEEVLERLGEAYIFRNGDGEVEGIKHHAMVAPLVELVRRLYAQVDALQQRVEELEVNGGGVPEKNLA